MTPSGDTFLERYGFGRAKKFLLLHDGKTYDSKLSSETPTHSNSASP